MIIWNAMSVTNTNHIAKKSTEYEQSSAVCIRLSSLMWFPLLKHQTRFETSYHKSIRCTVHYLSLALQPDMTSRDIYLNCESASLLLVIEIRIIHMRWVPFITSVFTVWWFSVLVRSHYQQAHIFTISHDSLLGYIWTWIKYQLDTHTYSCHVLGMCQSILSGISGSSWLASVFSCSRLIDAMSRCEWRMNHKDKNTLITHKLHIN